MVIKKYFDDLKKTYDIYLDKDSMSAITVDSYRVFGIGVWTEPKINWYCCGAMPIDYVKKYAKALNKAIELCRKMKRELRMK